MDPSQIDQLLVNLCVNARDAIGYSEPQEGTVFKIYLPRDAGDLTKKNTTDKAIKKPFSLPDLAEAIQKVLG